MQNFSVNYTTIDIIDITDTHKYLTKKRWHKIMSGFALKMFLELLSTCTIGRFSGSLASNPKGNIKCVSLNNQPSQGRPNTRQ